jgi:hypothetical protein
MAYPQVLKVSNTDFTSDSIGKLHARDVTSFAWVVRRKNIVRWLVQCQVANNPLARSKVRPVGLEAHVFFQYALA